MEIAILLYDNFTALDCIGPYEVLGLIGRGTTGLVVKAREPRLDRFVAIKLMAPQYSSNGSARHRFEREARAIAAVADRMLEELAKPRPAAPAEQGES